LKRKKKQKREEEYEQGKKINMKLLIAILILATVLIAGCTQQNTGIVCNSPYIRHEVGCCLDQNENKICDTDEIDLCEYVVCNDYCSEDTLYYNGTCIKGQCNYSSQVCQYGCDNFGIFYECRKIPEIPPSCIGGALFIRGTPECTGTQLQITLEVYYVNLSDFKADSRDSTGAIIDTAKVRTDGPDSLAEGEIGTVNFTMTTCSGIDEIRVTTNCFNVGTDWTQIA